VTHSVQLTKTVHFAGLPLLMVSLLTLLVRLAVMSVISVWFQFWPMGCGRLHHISRGLLPTLIIQLLVWQKLSPIRGYVIICRRGVSDPHIIPSGLAIEWWKLFGVRCQEWLQWALAIRICSLNDLLLSFGRDYKYPRTPYLLLYPSFMLGVPLKRHGSESTSGVSLSCHGRRSNCSVAARDNEVTQRFRTNQNSRDAERQWFWELANSRTRCLTLKTLPEPDVEPRKLAGKWALHENPIQRRQTWNTEAAKLVTGFRDHFVAYFPRIMTVD
jgi:hypothetical protein